ncbi:MAG: tetratricopeptide repeat protein [Nostoc sp. NMS7]|uniref:tetratricopeptide repeat protein n=1 Tax=Nostoc sp. NMS7 TaxID=2815391 RepID=UPI0025FFC7F4|nr:tetratricopeptide repeat protein [Nostoc sp. NMS7]MBN3950876.1 tetratricopeptide repeat protein [Nostoc sp. NMS7]
MDWTTTLKAQQADFIQRLKAGCLLNCEIEGQHSELTVILGEKLKQLRKFCWRMANKYKQNADVEIVFINHMKGKLGEEVVKARLANLVTEIDYETRLGGDGKVDFFLTSTPSVGIQVKARHSSIETVQWSVTQEEVEKNAVLICILIQEEVSEAQAEYHLIQAGFLPTVMITVNNGTASVKIDELLYCGGLQSYLENLDSLESEDLSFGRHKEQKESKQDIERNENENPLVSLDAQSKAFAYLSVGIDRYAKQKYEKAIEDFDDVISLHPNIPEAYNKRGLAHRKLADYRGAIQDFTQAFKLGNFLAAGYIYNRGFTHIKIGNKQGAIADFKEAADLFQKQGNQNFYNIALKKIRQLQQETKYQNHQKPNWKVGDCVSHKDFGIGQVTHVFGSGDRLSLAINFNESNQKIIDPKWVRLVKVD